MSGNSIGQNFVVTTFGESHGVALGCIIDGVPPGLELNEADMQHDLDRRRPGTSRYTTARREADEVRILSGVFEGKTTGTSIGLMIENTDQRSKYYSNIKDLFRPGHADYTYQQKYGIRDASGGGRSSARTTAPNVAAGAIALKVLETCIGGDKAKLKIVSWVESVGEIKANLDFSKVTTAQVESNHVRCPDPEAAKEMEQKLMHLWVFLYRVHLWVSL